jgi:hypothetical protein
MLQILELYVSGFWIWLGITIGLGIVTKSIVALIVGSIEAMRGGNVHIGDIEK